LGVEDAVAEFCMGHGIREAYGYSREMENESHVVGELSKLWNASTSATTRDLEERDARIERLETRLTEARTFLQHVSQFWQPKPPATKKGTVIEWDPGKMGLKWPLPEGKKPEKT
jgi:hypothetical protein